METDNCVFIGVACSDCSFSECVSVVCVGFIKQLVLSQHPILCVYGAGPLLIVLIAFAHLYHIHTHARAYTHTHTHRDLLLQKGQLPPEKKVKPSPYTGLSQRCVCVYPREQCVCV